MPNEEPITREKRLIDALQVIAPLAQQLERTARQPQRDVAALLEAVERAVAEARTAPL